LAQYNADIRIGIVGKSGLNALEKQLKRINTLTKELNKRLNFKARAQTVKLETRGAMTAVRQLEERINRLGRTITVNLKVNEKGKRSSDSGGGGGGGAAVAGAGLAAALSKPGTSQKIRDYTATTKALYEKEGQALGKLERLEKGREKVKNRMLEDQKEINNLVNQRMNLEKKLKTRLFFHFQHRLVTIETFYFLISNHYLFQLMLFFDH